MQNKGKKMIRKQLLVYDKNNIEEFKNSLPCGYDNVYPISYLTNSKLALRYTSIDGVDILVMDITVMVMSAKDRPDLRIMYEGWINALNETNEDNIYYCVENVCVKDACEIFGYYFEPIEYKENVINDRGQENVEIIAKKEERVLSIVEYDEPQFNDLMTKIESRLYGHAVFKADLKKQLKAFILLHRIERKKLFSMLLCGKSGIGKTEVGRLFHDIMYHKENPIKINFGNYSGKGSLWSLIGSPRGYIGSEQGGELTNKIQRSKSKIIVIDELDKADEAIFTFFYEMLEDGQYTDLEGNLVDLEGYIVIFTANLNNNNFKEKIPEPLFSRFDMAVEFDSLSSQEISNFVNDYIEELMDAYEENIGEIQREKIKKDILFKKRFTEKTNLRNVKREVMNEFVNSIGLEQVWGSTEKGDSFCDI